MAISEDFQAHMQSGLTTVARCWQIVRGDGVTLGFTDHDCDLVFADTVFRAGSGLTALSLEQSTGLSVDNTEAMGALSDAAISEVDIEAGRFDGAKVTAWMVNWADVAERMVVFRGSIGDIVRAGGAFQVELRGLTEPLNQPMGRVYQKPCGAILGDGACGFDVLQDGFFAEVAVQDVEDRRVFRFEGLTDYAPGWFARGRLDVLSGNAEGLSVSIKSDQFDGQTRVIELWAPLRAEIAAGDALRLVAGCDKRFETCRAKFSNQMNFQGFPDIPGDSWIATVPRQDGVNSGGSLRS